MNVTSARRKLSAKGVTVSAVALSIAVAASLSALGAPAEAGSRSYSTLAQHSTTPVIHRTVGESRRVTLPFAKSTVIDLPADARDIFIADPTVVKSVTHTARRVMLIGAKPGQTNAFFYGENGSELLTLDIRVERDITGLKDLVAQHAPSAKIDIQPVNNNLLLTGSVPNAASAARIESLANMWLDEAAGGGTAGNIVNLLTVEGRDQVMLKVRIVEMQRSVTKQLGINLSAIGQLGDATVSLFSNNGLATGAGFDSSVNWQNTSGGDLRSLTGAIQALERVGLIRTLAEPTLTAISGETASFLSGGEFPLLTGTNIDQNGTLQRQFEFKPFGVSLGFTPVVLSEGRISLNISTEVSEPTTEGSFETGGTGGDILGLRVRRAESVVEMPAGGSLVIAGLIREETRQSSDGIPGIKNIPGLGAAFRNRDDINTQQELMIIVTPYLVEPTHPDRLQTPLDGMVQANDRETLLLGRLNRAYDGTGAPVIEANTLPGPFGHVVD